jgi:hypothetical protein
VDDIDIWAQRLAHYLQEHMDTEREALRSYAHLAEETQSDRIRFLINMILDDEVRHHRIFQDLVNWLRAEHSQRTDIDTAIGHGSVTNVGPEREHLLEMTAGLVELEKEDQRELKKLQKMVTDMPDTEWWWSLVEAMKLDTRKHAMLLEAVIKLATEAA